MFLRIFLDVLAPILLMIGIGALLRWRFKIDIGALTKLNIYVFVPGFVFHRVANSQLDWGQMAGITTITALNVAVLGGIVWIIGRAMRVDARTLAAVAMAVMFYNSGNYGLPLAQLAYGDDAAAAQTFVLLTQNILTFTVGLSIAVYAGGGSFGSGMKKLISLPIIPTLACAFFAKWWLSQDPTRTLPVVINKPAQYIADGLVAIALITLGAQLVKNPRWPRWKPVAAIAGMRLVVSGIMMAGYFWLLRVFWPEQDVFADVDPRWIILTACVPTAVNTLLLTLELEGDADLAADAVFWTTVFSTVTIMGWLLVLGT